MDLNIAPPRLSAGLYIVATPIGNLRDITLRALDTLLGVDMVYCEDTRVSGKLMKAYDIKAMLKVYNDHSDSKIRDTIIRDIRDGKSIALISDAGMPLISDPGYKLVRECLEHDIKMTSLPGASAGLMALQLSGLPSDSFSFIGFLPSKTKARQDILKRWAHTSGSLIAYENGSRLLAMLKDIQNTMGHRQVSVARELTKLYEEVRHGCVTELITFYENSPKPKGEIVVIIGEGDPEIVSDDDIEEMLKDALKSMGAKDAVDHVLPQTDWPKRKLYNLAISLKP